MARKLRGRCPRAVKEELYWDDLDNIQVWHTNKHAEANNPLIPVDENYV